MNKRNNSQTQDLTKTMWNNPLLASLLGDSSCFRSRANHVSKLWTRKVSLSVLAVKSAFLGIIGDTQYGGLHDLKRLRIYLPYPSILYSIAICGLHRFVTKYKTFTVFQSPTAVLCLQPKSLLP